MHIWPTEEVCAGIYTLLCMFRPVIKHYSQERITNVKNVNEKSECGTFEEPSTKATRTTSSYI